MTVYADILVIVNLYVDFFLLWSVKKLLRLKTKNLRLIAGALVGGLSSLTSLLPVPGGIVFLFGVISALLCTGAAFLPMSKSMFIKTALCFWILSFILAGFLLFLGAVLPFGIMTVIGNAVYFSFSPAFLFSSTAGAYLVFYIFNRIFPKKPELRYCRLSIENNGSSITLFCKADTGCELKEPFSGLPVIVAQKDSLKNTVPEQVLTYSEKGTADGPIRLIPFSSIGGGGLLPAFRPEKAVVKNTELDCYIAVFDKKLSASGYDGLLNPDLFPQPLPFDT